MPADKRPGPDPALSRLPLLRRQFASNRPYDAMVRDMVEVDQVGPLTIKGFQRPITAYNVLGMKGVRR